jgi:YD repeat-containing protein
MIFCTHWQHSIALGGRIDCIQQRVLRDGGWPGPPVVSAEQPMPSRFRTAVWTPIRSAKERESSPTESPVANFPTLETVYGYDALNNLVSVNQKGTSSETPRIRVFVYDSLSRLTSSTNPETGTIGYGYGANGNMTSKTDARGVTTSYIYDSLNRLTSKRSAGASGVPGSTMATPTMGQE